MVDQWNLLNIFSIILTFCWVTSGLPFQEFLGDTSIIGIATVWGLSMFFVKRDNISVSKI